MAKVVFGEYSAFTTKNNMVRFQKHNKLVSEKVIPPEVVLYLKKQLGLPSENIVEPKFPMPTEEEKARLRAESLKVPVELQGENTTVTEEQLLTPVEQLTDEDFDDVIPESITQDEPTPDPKEMTAPPSPGATNTPVSPDFLESVSIHTASLFDMVHAMYERFGIYSVYLGELPQGDEINPLTGEVFTKYHLGIAYQAAIRAQSTGVLTVAPELGRKIMDEGRAASANFTVDPVPQTMGEARRANSFDYRTSPQGTRTVPATEVVHVTGEDGIVRAVQRAIPAGQTGEFNGAAAQYDAEEDEPIVQPQFGKQVIRPNW